MRTGLRWCRLRGCVGRHTHRELRFALVEERDCLSLLIRIKVERVFRVVISDSLCKYILLRRAELACARKEARLLHARRVAGRRVRRSAGKRLAGIACACVDAACVVDWFCLSHQGGQGERVLGKSRRRNALRVGAEVPGRGGECESVGHDRGSHRGGWVWGRDWVGSGGPGSGGGHAPRVRHRSPPPA